MTTTTTTTANNIIKVTEGTMAGDVFYGSFDTRIKDKTISVMVSNHIKDVNKEYEFRIAGKCRAGFINIHDTKGTAHSVIAGYKKNSLVNIQENVFTRTEWNFGTMFSLLKEVNGTELTKRS